MCGLAVAVGLTRASGRGFTWGRELNLMLEFRSIARYSDPEILLGSVLEDLRREEGLDAYADRMRVVVEDVDSGFYAAFDPGG